MLLKDFNIISCAMGFPGGLEVKASACNARDLGSIPGSGRCPGEGNGNPLQHSCLENPMDVGAWWATVHGVARSRTWLSDLHDTRQDLCCTLGPGWLCILNVAMCICPFWSPDFSPPPSTLVTIYCLVCLWACFCFGNKLIYIIFFKFPHVSNITWYLPYSILLHSVWQSLGPHMLL